jgi:hypothetical protein
MCLVALHFGTLEAEDEEPAILPSAMQMEEIASQTSFFFKKRIGFRGLFASLMASDVLPPDVN